VTRCTGCRHDDGKPATEAPPVTSHCNHCGDWPCETCGGTNNLATDVSCPCWVSFDGLPLADIKGLLAGLDLSLEH
jgi:hypothetical protein